MLMSSLTQLVKTLHSLNSRGLWLSLYEQTLAELALARSVHSLVQDPNRNIPELLQGLDLVSTLLADAKAKPGTFSTQSLAVLRGLFLLVGTQIVSKVSSIQYQPTVVDAAPVFAQQMSLLDLSDLPSSISGPSGVSFSSSSSQMNPATLLLERIQKIGNAAEWAIQLLQPSASDIAHEHWLEKAFDCDTYSQMEFLRLIGQIPWRELVSLNTEQVKQSVLLPLQKLLSTAAKRNFLSLIVTIGKATATIGCLFPELALSCVAILMRSPWPSKAITVPLLTRCFPWESLSCKDDAVLLFGELYQLFQPRPAEYAALRAQNRQDHRNAFIKYAINLDSQAPAMSNFTLPLADISPPHCLLPQLYINSIRTLKSETKPNKRLSSLCSSSWLCNTQNLPRLQRQLRSICCGFSPKNSSFTHLFGEQWILSSQC